MRTFVVPLLIAVALLTGSVADSRAQELSVHIDYFERGVPDEDAVLTAEVYTALKSAFELRGVAVTPTSMSDMVLSARYFDAGSAKFIVISIAQGAGLTEPVIKAAAENEIFYADKQRPENVEEGAFVRQYVTEEFMRNLTLVHGMQQLVFPAHDLDMHISQFVDEFVHRRTCLARGTCDDL